MEILGTGSINGEIAITGDKSISHRSVIISSLIDKPVKIKNYLFSSDCIATLDVLRKLGFHQYRLRFHGDLCRIEIERQDMDKILNNKKRSNLVKKIISLGFKYVTMDLEGYRKGLIKSKG